MTNTKIEKKEISVNKRCWDIRNKIRVKKEINFIELFDIVNKEYVVVTFLAILSMARSGEITIKQDANFNEITIKAKE